MQAFVPDFVFHIYDFSPHSAAKIKGDITLQACLLAIKAVFDDQPAQKLKQIFALLDELADKNTALEYIEVVFRYIAWGTDKISFADIQNIALQGSSPEKEDKIMTIAEELMQKGRQQGLILNRKNVLVRLMNKKFSISNQDNEFIDQVNDPERLDRAIDEIIFAKTKEDVMRYLH